MLVDRIAPRTHARAARDADRYSIPHERLAIVLAVLTAALLFTALLVATSELVPIALALMVAGALSALATIYLISR